MLNPDRKTGGEKTYLSSAGAWALAFGCAVGWGSFVMPGTTFLPLAGPAGTALGLGFGALIMLILGANYHHLMMRYPDAGGTYTYTKHCFGYDHGFLSAWFLILTYIAVLWANATALPLIARAVLGGTFQFGYIYEIAGYPIYLGEILLAWAALILGGLVCMNRKRAEKTQIVMAALLLCGVCICFLGALIKPGTADKLFSPAFSPRNTPVSGTLTIFALAPWAFVGFESISHSAGEASFSLKRTFPILLAAVMSAGAAYVLLVLLSVSSLPEGCSSWADYIFNLEKYQGSASLPTFHAAHAALGTAGTVVLTISAFSAIMTGLIGNYIALSRLLSALADDGLFPAWVGKRDANQVPRSGILLILVISLFLPFLGRTAISWIVDVTTVGATVAYALTSAAALKSGRGEGRKRVMFTGAAGLFFSLFFAVEFLIPNLLSIKALSTESYLILSVWSILGFVYFLFFLRRDKERRMGRSIVAWMVLLGLIIFTSSVWMRQATENAMVRTIENVETAVVENPEARVAYVQESLSRVGRTLDVTLLIQLGIIVVSLGILLEIYSIIQKRERQTEVEKILAEESSRAKTSFLSNMSHEIRTPMNAIIGLDNIALRDPDISQRTRQHLEKIGASAKHLLGLINDILDMSRIESGRMVLKNEEFSFREFLEQINVIINGQCQDKGLNYECNIVGNVGDYYYGDDMKLKQVLINILGNSVKFTPKGGTVSLTIEQMREFEGFCSLRFTMRDTGIGMDKEYIPKIFEAFSQEDAASNRYGGSGLGMAITRSFVDMMNGEIHIDSEKGVGTVFTVTVTLKASTRSVQADSDFSLPEGLHALIVDDDEIACEHTQVVMRSIGIESETVTSPEKALEKLRSAHQQGNPYPLLLTDYKMPGLNGMQLVRALREFDGGETMAIMLTGYNGDVSDEELSSNGLDGILGKPFFSDTLLRELRHVMDRRRGIEQAANTGMEEEKILEILSGRRVLMAEDVEQNAEILADLLEMEEMVPEHAENGQKAVEMFAQSGEGYYDIILMDVRMPVMDGLSATKAIRAMGRPDAQTIPIIAMTANVFDEDVEKSLQAGMNAHLSKPVEPDRLYETMVRMILQRT